MTLRLLTLTAFLFLVGHLGANTFVVTNSNDSGPGSLRQAITEANAHPNAAGGENITFNIPGAGVHTIVLESALPEITEGVLLDGWTQPGWDGIAPLIELTALGGVAIDGLAITGGATTIRGLVMNGFQAAIKFSQNGNNAVKGCYLGTDKTGQLPAPNDYGIYSLSTSDNLIGGTIKSDQNVISGNRFNGLLFLEQDPRFIQTRGNTIQGNYVGTDVTGTMAVPNCTASATGATGLSGITIICNGATIGGPETGAGNLISGNASSGLALTGGGALIAGNLVGTDVTGSAALPNHGTGISMSSLGGTIGGTVEGARNVVSGNAGAAIGVASSNGIIQGNFVGTDITGMIALPNGSIGIALAGRDNLIGGSGPGAGNLISGNAGGGIGFFPGVSFVGPFQTEIPAQNNVVQGNRIGTDLTGMTALPNGSDGIYIARGDAFGATGNRIGGNVAGAGNVISGNLGNGIRIEKAGKTVIQGNRIGTANDATKSLANGQAGIHMIDCASSSIGATLGPDLDAANTIAFNLGDGVTLTGQSQQQRISSNSIHDNGQLGIDLGNDATTPNDAGDADTGANGLQNFPVISAAFGFNSNLTIYGGLGSRPSTSFILEFFANHAADNSGFGEGQVLLGQARVTTSSSGDAAFNVTFPLPANAAVVSAIAIDPNGNTSEFSADVSVSPTAPSPPPTSPTMVFLPMHSLHLLNVSTRLRVETGDHALIAGLIVSGSEPKKVIVRGIGPSLSSSNVPGVLADPILELYDAAGQLVSSNDNWKSDQQSEIENSGLAPTNDLESAIVATLSPGNYTAVLRGKGETTGVGLVEAYDLARGSRSHLANLSTRGFVTTGDNIMIAGIIIADNGGGTTVVVRALGPSLAAAGVPDALIDPYLELRNPNGGLVDFNDNWASAFQVENIRAAHLAPSDDRESALYKSLAPGNYTAIVRGKNNAIGVALVEVYDIGPQ